jgi:transcriptional regulator GlxA family with amidase domain
LEILFELSGKYNMTLSMVAPTLGPQTARPPLSENMIGPATVATHTFENAPPLDVIIVPGGGGLDKYELDNNTQIEDFLVSRNESTPYILSVCTGAVTLAKSGLLSGKRATTNKAAYPYVTDPKHGDDIQWVPSARWVVDGKFWTSSGVAAGMDMMYAFLKHIYGEEEWVDWVLNLIEYVPHTDPHWDPFAVVWKVSSLIIAIRLIKDRTENSTIFS